ncbi:hypothetical protein C8J57DRAFT_1510527 [Mycena rebaudengoi]|nr:hypothetical protein C8J57DRAFT_1510527 [Mycena rebaudengoi]
MSLAEMRQHGQGPKYSKARLKSNLKQPDTTRSAADKGLARLSSARKSWEIHTTQLDEQQAKLYAAQKQAEDLRGTLAHKRKILFLLETVESKQHLRTKRIVELMKMIDHSRQGRITTCQSSQQVKFKALPSFETKTLRISNTRDSIANLHSRLVKSSTVEVDGALRLRKSIAHSLGRDFNHPDTTQALHQCISLARTRANDIRKYPLIGELDARVESNRLKEEKLQSLLDLSLSLLLLPEHRRESIWNFTETSTHALRSSLQEEAQQSKGHVDILRLLITGEKLVLPPSDSFTAQVARICQMHGNVRVRNIVDEIERAIKHSHRRRNLVDMNGLPSPALIDQALIDNYRRNMQAARDRVTKVLPRKAEKAVVGGRLANDVEALLRESRLVIGLPTKD